MSTVEKLRKILPETSPGTRRQFLQLTGLGGLALAIEACGFVSVDGEIEDEVIVSYPDTPGWAITPTDDFYAFNNMGETPVLDGEAWRLVIDGAVNRSAEISLADLKGLGFQERLQTIACGGANPDRPWIGNAVWGGLRLPDILSALDIVPEEEVVELQWTAADGFTSSQGIADLDIREGWLVWEMNGVPLRPEHGFPARYLVANLMGVKCIKWPTRLHFGTEHRADHTELSFPGATGVPIGVWLAPRYNPICFFQFPQPGTEVAPGVVRLEGCAFAGSIPITKVEVSDDGGESWSEAEFAYRGPTDVWSLWHFDWAPPAPGRYDLLARVEAADGRVTDLDHVSEVNYKGPGRLTITVL